LYQNKPSLAVCFDILFYLSATIMKKIFILCVLIISSRSLMAQEVANESSPVPVAVQSSTATMTAQDSLKKSISEIKTAFSGMSKLFARKSDTISLLVSNIDYDNSNLTLLKDNLKKLKGVWSVIMHYNGTTAMMEIACKENSSDLWDKLPANLKSYFKVAEFGDKVIKLSYREKVP
jgi:hypothetical protein